MDNEKHWWAPGLGAGIVVAILVTLALVAVFGVTWVGSFLNGQAASWAQAIGAVVAIVAAYRLGRVQIHADRVLEAERRAQDDLRRIGTIDALLTNAEALCVRYKDVWDGRNGIPVSGPFGDYLSDCRAGIASIDPFECPATDLVIYLAQIPRELDEFRLAHEEYRAAFLRQGESRKSIQETFPELNTKLTRVIENIRDARKICAAEDSKIALKIGVHDANHAASSSRTCSE